MAEQDSRDFIAVIRAKLAAGTLPTARPSQVWAGESRGDVCDACDRPIAPAEMEYEVNITDHGVFRFHRACFDAWHQERARRLPESP
jgi:hypothetical protein